MGGPGRPSLLAFRALGIFWQGATVPVYNLVVEGAHEYFAQWGTCT